MRPRPIPIVAVVVLGWMAGWVPAPVCAPSRAIAFESSIPSASFDSHASTPDAAELWEAEQALHRAKASQAMGKADCVDDYFCAASLAWASLHRESFASHEIAPSALNPRALVIYHQAVGEMITQGQRHARWDPLRGLCISTREGSVIVPLAYHTSRWIPGDFDQLTVVDEVRSKHLNRYHRRRGFGVTTVATRSRRPGERFLPPLQFASMTVVLRWHAETPPMETQFNDEGPWVIELHDPLESPTVEVASKWLPLAADLSAPVHTAVATGSRDGLREFLQPGLTNPAESGLFMVQPFQPDKIPILFVHGLLSDRFTWANIVNEFRCQADLMDRYQLWSYQYPTGEPFLRSAARLRQQLREVHELHDPTGHQWALTQTVMVGHSMGGLISKLQVTSSGDDLWRAVSSRPLEQIVIDPEYARRLAEALYFEPSPTINRVIFIGTPHRGSVIAQRAIGRLGSLLIQDPTTTREVHRRVVQSNPGVFSPEFARRVPTSVDLLEPSSPLLQAIARLPIDHGVRYHSIIGRGRWMLGNGDSDGVVPVSSAKLGGASSEFLVHAKHTRLTYHPEVIGELFEILRAHLLEGTSIGAVPNWMAAASKSQKTSVSRSYLQLTTK